MIPKRRLDPDVSQDPFFAQMKDEIIRLTGLAYYQDKEADLARILAARLAASGYGDCASYAAFLSSPQGVAEMDELISELTIGETYFFRHPEVFAALRRHVVPDILARNVARKSIRIWSAGCSSGAEPYSISILLNHDFKTALAGWQIGIHGSDIDKKFLAQAKSGLYQDWAVRTTSQEDRRIFFERTASGWQLRQQYRQPVSFHYHNLIQDPLPSPSLGLEELDLILCRNVAIYFSGEQIYQLMERFHDSLNDGGWLITGPAEVGMDRPPGFQPVNLDGLIVYRKGDKPVHVATPAWTPPEVALSALFADPVLPSLPEEVPLETGACPDGAEGDQEAHELQHLAGRGQWIAASGPARRILARANPSLEISLKAVQVLIELGDFDGGEKALKRMLFVDRKCEMAYYHLGLLLSCRGDQKMAQKAFKNASDLAAALPASQPVPGGEGVTAGQLAAMARLRAKPRCDR